MGKRVHERTADDGVTICNFAVGKRCLKLEFYLTSNDSYYIQGFFQNFSALSRLLFQTA